jgi:predicted anti-sigma-YlaC factor YlaD
MNHLSEEELILHYYSEEGDAFAAEQHLDQCDDCRAHYASLQRVLNVVDSLPVPVRGEEYGGEVWRRIEGRLPSRRRWWSLEGSWRWAGAAAALASLVVVAFLAGRMFPTRVAPKTPAPVETIADKQGGERVLLVAVGDLLERSQMVLIELNHATPSEKLDISAERERAADLASENRLYRQTALKSGDTTMAGVLDDLERVLVDIAHEPPQMAPAELENLQHRMESAGILFKIRVLGTNVKQKQEAAGPVGRPDRQKL